MGHILTGDAWAGAEKQAWELVRRLPACGMAPRVAILNRGETFERFSALPTPTELVDSRGQGRQAQARGVHAWIQRSELALVHVHKRKEELLVAFGVTSRRPPLIRTLHGAPELPVGWSRIKGIVARELDFLALRHRTAAVIAVSEELAERLRPRLGKTMVRVIHNGVSVLPTTTGAQEPHPPRLGYCGRLAPVKALDRLLRAMPEVRRRVPAAELWIVGAGGEEPALRRLARSLAIEPAVRFLGFQAEIEEVLAALDVVVLCSRHEGLPMILLEAGAAGKPVVAPRLGGIPEVIEPGVTGILLDEATPTALAAACADLLGDLDRATALGAAARARVREAFSADATARATARLYRDVLAGRGPECGD